MAGKQHVRILTLELNQNGTSVVYKLQKDWILQFRLGPSLLGESVSLHTNYPLKDGVFDRNHYNGIPWQKVSTDDTSIYANIEVKISGSFHFYLAKTKYVPIYFNVFVM